MNFFSTPILLIVWRRPQETKKVIKALRVVKPKILFIAYDGPKKILKRICKSKRDYRSM